MKQTFLFLLFGYILTVACNEKEEKTPTQRENLVEIKDGQYSEWYPGKKQLKFRGALDSLQQRDGKWEFYSERGLVLSMTEYRHGKRNGFSIVKYPNGRIHYRGEYLNDEQVGRWTTYDTLGKVVDEKIIEEKL
jgi:antitoxin component YwqK of YwqJK toxin-antitoxin module